MPEIAVLDQETINQIAAGEVIDRPSSVVKELLENAIDAGATAVTVEIRDGGISLIRVTDNGCGIEKEQISRAFLRHATSKIRSAVDLLTVSSLGFRGEALSSIAAVSQVELITKTAAELTGTRYQNHGGEEISLEVVGAPEGTTFLVRNLFYNTPARKKFLKSPQTEGSYISSLVERMALSRPDISIRFIQNNQNRLHTSGNHNLKDLVYMIFGREISANLVPMEIVTEQVQITGFLGKPLISRGNRTYENYFINGRYIKSNLINKAIEDGYHSYMMQHKYPFVILHLEIKPELLDVNVHPSKMELRFSNQEEIYNLICHGVRETLAGKELIRKVCLEEEKKPSEMVSKEAIPLKTSIPKNGENRNFSGAIKGPEPFEVKRSMASAIPPVEPPKHLREHVVSYVPDVDTGEIKKNPVDKNPLAGHRQMELFEEKMFSREARKQYRFLGQLFDTYWLVQYKEDLLIVDQHAAHEKVLYERLVNQMAQKKIYGQMVSPPILLTLNMREEEILMKFMERFRQLGFEIESFGGKEYAVSSVPANLYGIAQRELLLELLDSLTEELSRESDELILEKLASMSCKAAVKGGDSLSVREAEALIDELLALKNPYACPHGRPTIIAISKRELEKKFKRII